MRSTRFTKGNQAEKRRKHRRGGRPTRTQAQLKKLAADMVKKRLEDGMGSIVDTYISLATGMPVGDKICRLDPATTRHAIDRFVSQAPPESDFGSSRYGRIVLFACNGGGAEGGAG